MKKSVWLVGLLAALLILPACSKKEEKPKETAMAPQQQAQPAAPAATSEQAMPAADSMAMGDMAQGEKVYNESCKACHDEGIAGAPKIGDPEAWADRVAQGMDTLDKNAIDGFTGKTGTMPPKGGNAALSDEDVKAAVEYMVSKSK
jgi:cytochrome c5